MNLKTVGAIIDGITHSQVILDIDEMKIGQRFTLPNQVNPDVKQFEGNNFFTSEIDRGPGGSGTIVYKFNTDLTRTT